MALKKEEYPVRLDLKEEDDRVIRYLKGETISLVNEEGPVKGWCLVTVEGFPLGWAKGSGMTLKNKYYAGWRWQENAEWRECKARSNSVSEGTKYLFVPTS